MSLEQPVKGSSRPIGFGIFTLVAGLVGWFASFELLTEFIQTLRDPEYIPNCNVSILVTCGPNMDSWQGSLLGFSNTIIGVTTFVVPIVIGVALLAGVRFPVWFWRLYLIGLLLGFTFVTWLQYQSIFSLGTLCPWCMVVWTAMIPLWWITFFRSFALGDATRSVRVQKSFQTLYQWTWVVIFVNFVVIATVAQLILNWFREFTL